MKWKSFAISLALCLGLALGLWGLKAGLAGTAQRSAQAGLDEVLHALLPGSENFVQEDYTGEDESIRAVYKGEGGYVLRVTTAGYVDDVTLMVGVWNDGTVSGVWVQDMSETAGLGDRATYDIEFLSQLVNTKGDLAIASGEGHGADGETSATAGATTVVTGTETEIDAMSGATVTSKAVVRAVNSAAAFVTGADVSSSATEWGG